MRLATVTWGDGGRRALLLHGVSSSAAEWWRLAPDLAALGYTVVAPDLRGHGSSDPGGDYLLASYRDDVLEVGSGWDHVIGHSLGGAIATLCHDADNGFARSFVLVEPWIVLADRGASLAWLLAPYNGEISIDAQAGQHPRWAAQDVTASAEALAACHPDVLARTVADNAPWDLCSELRHITVPVLLLGADPAVGALVSPAQGMALAVSRRITFRSVEGAGHWLHRDDYEVFWDEVRRVASV
jgi:pimeloyl-ACP methyl ester carboxylesterase